MEVVVQPALHLDLPEALQQQPPDLCRTCAKQLEEVGGREGQGNVVSGGIACLVPTLDCAVGQWMVGSGLALPQACTKLVWACQLAATLPAASRHALQNELAEEGCRAHQSCLQEEFQPWIYVGAPSSAATT